MAALLLLFVTQGRQHDGWPAQFLALLAGTLGSMLLVRFASDKSVGSWWFQAGLFLGDAIAASVVLNWIQPRPELFGIYFIVVLGSALTRSPRQSLIISGSTMAVYAIAWWTRGRVTPVSVFLLRLMFLATASALLAILGLDAASAQEEEKRRYDERLIQVERLAILGRAAAEVAHRIKGPLTTIAVDAEVLSHRHAGDKATLKELAQILEEVGRCKEILKNLLDLGRIEEMDTEPLDLRAPVERAVKLIAPLVKDRGAKLATSGLDAAMPARGDESLIQEALYALLQNAVEAARRGGSIRLEAATWGGAHRVSVVDDGAGVTRGELEKIFQPFYTTKKDGSGLGLSAALRIAQKHGGTVEAESDGAGRGARFTLTIPAR
jgi:signal transduction histidine kinase